MARCRPCPSEWATRRRRPTTASTSPCTASRSTAASSRRIGKESALRRERLRLPVIDEAGRVSTIRPGPGLLAYRHLSLAGKLRAARVTLRLRGLTPSEHCDETFGALLRRLGQRQPEIDRFWDVFIRPALNMRSDEAGADYGIFTVQTALLGPRGRQRPPAPGRAARRDARARRRQSARAGRRRRRGSSPASSRSTSSTPTRSCSPLPPGETAQLLGEVPPALEDSPIVSVHMLFDRPILPHPLAALLDSPAHWVFDRGRLTGPPAGSWRPVPDGRLERRSRAARRPRPGARRPDGGRPERASRSGRARLVARQPRAARDFRGHARDA